MEVSDTSEDERWLKFGDLSAVWGYIDHNNDRCAKSNRKITKGKAMNSTCKLNLALGTIIVILGFQSSACAREVVYTPIPEGFDFPADSDVLINALQAGDVAALRRHAWMVFAGLTQPARPDDASSEALWETWFRSDEVFNAGPIPQGARSLMRKLEVPRQFSPHGGAQTQAAGASQLAFTLFNEELKDHTRSHHFYLMDTMRTINNGWTAQTQPQNRKIEDFKPKAMSLKLVWMAVKESGRTPLPIWDEHPRVSSAPPQDFPTWKRQVVVDPSRDTIPESERQDIPGFPKSRVVPLKSFYHFVMDAAQAAMFGVSEGDYAVLVAMHYTTKEIPNWVWATFWWHDQPNVGKYAEDRPDNIIISDPWRNYLMDVSYDMDLPQESDGTPNAVFNPWLEARFANGANSNCMTCHQRAVWSEENPFGSFLPITRGKAPDNDPIFLNGTKTDFLWSLLLEGNQ